MLTEERYNKILQAVNQNNCVTAQQLVTELNISESTVRRDLAALDKLGRLKRIRGGATAIEQAYDTTDQWINKRSSLNIEEKRKIGKYAASLIEKSDFVYIDAGTTTEIMTDYILEKSAVYVTNSLIHANALSKKGLRVFVIGGEFKPVTEAIIGIEAVESLAKYNFTKGFFGVNGISKQAQLSTPEINEALVKKAALAKCKRSFVLADGSKFDKISAITFGNLNTSLIITDKLPNKEYLKIADIKEVSE